MPSSPDRRLVILAEGNFGYHHGKTAMGVIRFGQDKVVAVIDSTQAGRNVREWLGDSGRFDIPIVSTLSEALGFVPRADALLIGIAPTGGRLPDAWRQVILSAIRSGLDILSGLHTFLGDDPEFADAARSSGVRITDYRRPPERMETAVGRPPPAGQARDPHRRDGLRDREDDRRAGAAGAAPRRSGRSASFVPTGQTGMMIEGWGVSVDRVVSDFVQGTCEWLSEEGERRGDWVFVEGQGSLDHPAYSSVTLGLIHGFTPHAMVLVHMPGLERARLRARAGPPLPAPAAAGLHPDPRGGRGAGRPVEGGGGRAQHLAHRGRGGGSRRSSPRPRRRPGCPCDDPVRFGGEALWRRIEVAVEALPWVVPAPSEEMPV